MYFTFTFSVYSLHLTNVHTTCTMDTCTIGNTKMVNFRIYSGILVNVKQSFLYILNKIQHYTVHYINMSNTSSEYTEHYFFLQKQYFYNASSVFRIIFSAHDRDRLFVSIKYRMLTEKIFPKKPCSPTSPPTPHPPNPPPSN